MDPPEPCKSTEENKALKVEGKKRKNGIAFHKAENNEVPN